MIEDLPSYVYDGKEKKPDVTVKYNGKTLKSKYYSVKYQSGRKIVGTYKVSVTGKGTYKGKTAKATFKITKANNPIKVIAKKPSMSISKLKKKAQTLAVSKLVAIKKNQGKLTYKVTSKKSGISFNSKTNKLKLQKGLKRGTYPITVTVTAKGNTNYKKGSKIVNVNIKVK